MVLSGELISAIQLLVILFSHDLRCCQTTLGGTFITQVWKPHSCAYSGPQPASGVPSEHLAKPLVVEPIVDTATVGPTSSKPMPRSPLLYILLCFHFRTSTASEKGTASDSTA